MFKSYLHYWRHQIHKTSPRRPIYGKKKKKKSWRTIKGTIWLIQSCGRNRSLIGLISWQEEEEEEDNKDNTFFERQSCGTNCVEWNAWMCCSRHWIPVGNELVSSMLCVYPIYLSFNKTHKSKSVNIWKLKKAMCTKITMVRHRKFN
jgi:hypothetical protein